MGMALLPLPRAIRSRRPSIPQPSPPICSRCTCSALSSSCTTRGWNCTRRCARSIDSSRMRRWRRHQPLRRSRNRSPHRSSSRTAQNCSKSSTVIPPSVLAYTVTPISTLSAHAFIEWIKQSAAGKCTKMSIVLYALRSCRQAVDQSVCSCTRKEKKRKAAMEVPQHLIGKTIHAAERESGRHMRASSLRRHHRPSIAGRLIYASPGSRWYALWVTVRT
jgi:hypothetical protein